MKIQKTIQGIFAFVMILCCGAIAGKASAVDRFVATTGADTGDCSNSGAPCLTVGYAVGQAVSGDQIIVAAGTYNFSSVVLINKQLSLLGAQAGVDARNRVATETILTGAGGVLSTAIDGVIIDGFTIQDQTNGILNGGAVWLQDSASGYQFLNNIVQNNVFGLYANSEGTTQTVVQFNWFQANNNAGAASGNGIYSDYGSHNILIDSNLFTGNDNCGLVYDTFNENNTDLTITNNRFEQNAEGVCLFATDGATIDNNDIVDSTDTGVIASVDVSDITIQNNRISNATNQAIRIGSNGGTGTQADVSIISNQLLGNGGGILMGSMGTQTNLQIHFNRIFDNTNFGLNNGSGVAVDAENNWWGCNAGPNDAAGDCDTVIGSNSDFDPWLVLRLEADPPIIARDRSSSLLADILLNSDGVDTSSAGTIPNDTPGTFRANLGSVSPVNVGSAAGRDSSNFTAPDADGNVQVCITVDNQDVCLDIVIEQTIPTPSPSPFPAPTLCLSGSSLIGKDGTPTCGGGCSLQIGETTAPNLVLGLLSFALVGFSLWKIRTKLRDSH